jgi:peptidoglycan/LPS O-acetylase OafA/YrhL
MNIQTKNIGAESKSFRPDIEMLRGFAVFFVLLFHLKISWFQGGFSGVDIFFVLSGFLIAATLGTPNRENIDFDVGTFYIFTF